MTDTENHIRELAGKVTPGWFNAMLAGFSQHATDAMTKTSREQAKVDLQIARDFASAIPTLVPILDAKDAEIARLREDNNHLRGEIGDAISQLGSGWFGTAESTLRAALLNRTNPTD